MQAKRSQCHAGRHCKSATWKGHEERRERGGEGGGEEGREEEREEIW